MCVSFLFISLTDLNCQAIILAGSFPGKLATAKTPKMSFSQLKICRPPPLSFDPVFMKDAHDALKRMKNPFFDLDFLSYR